MKEHKTIELGLEDIKAAVAMWLCSQGVKPVMETLVFDIQGESRPDDWRAEYNLDYVLKGATVKLK